MTKEITLLHVRGPGASAIGYGRYGLHLARSLTKAGVDVFNSIDDPNGPHHLDPAEHVNTRVGRTNVVMWASTPGHARGWWDGQYSVIGTMFEATRLPEAFREHLHNFNLVVVPSDQNKELFDPYHHNVQVAYLGVDPDEWFYIPREQPEREFRFLIGGSGERKGVDLAHKAFLKVFGKSWPKGGPVPKLVMKSPKGGDFYGDRVEMVTGRLTDDDERALYATAHCYLQPSRGEGFGLQPLQALAQGLPTILTDAHGHASFAHLGYGLSASLKQSDYFIYGDAGEWWEPDFDELCAYMEHVYVNWSEAEQRGKEAAVEVADRFTWANTARRYIDILGDELEKPYGGDGTWFKPDIKSYPVVLKQDFRTEVAGSSFLFRKGVTYFESSDVKRIMFEAGLLDPSCLEGPGEETGLLPSEVARIGAYSAKAEWCDCCGQRLNSGVTRADEIMAGNL